MGIYLSTPHSEVELEEGSGEKVRYVIGEMQGWRKAMEDAHIALADVESAVSTSSGSKFSLFAVFDGHGGKEVAKFAKNHYPKLVLEQLVANEGDVAMALRESFHRVDELLEDEQFWNELKELKSLPNPCDKANKARGAGPRNGGAALEDSDSSDDDDSPGARSRGAQSKRSLTNGTTPSSLADQEEGADEGRAISTTDAVRMIREMLKRAAARASSDEDDEEEGTAVEGAGAKGEGSEAKGSVLLEDGEGQSDSKDAGDSKECDAKGADGKAAVDEDDEEDDAAFQELLMEALTTAAGPSRSAARKSAEDKPAGGADAKNGTTHSNGLTVTMHENVDDAAESKKEGNGIQGSTSQALRVPSGAEDKDFPADTDISPKPVGTSAEAIFSPGAPILPARPTLASSSKKAAANPDASPVIASRKTEGGVTCNLKPHRIMAGCTAVVALHVGNHLYVANAGDSRGVLCRKGGQAYALSYDHKPQQEREMSRIVAAGGFVNAVGRVNGNLNLSRSLGDLKYKQVVQCSREEQMITAEPDITLTELQEGDRFFILACDGVWDCLSNQQACDFVSERLDKGLDVATITKELLHHCLAPDTASAAGVGCDNMTFLLVLLNQ